MHAASYSAIADEVFAPLYPYYAEKIVRETGIRYGRCLDVGCGCGHLGLAMLNAGIFKLCSLDCSAEMLERMWENALQHSVTQHVTAVKAHVQAMPLPDAHFELVVSRGSIPFWSDLGSSFAEIWRVLKRGGEAYLGGGLGPSRMREQIEERMRAREPDGRWREAVRIPRRSVEEYQRGLDEARIPDAAIVRDDEGTWIRFRRP